MIQINFVCNKHDGGGVDVIRTNDPSVLGSVLTGPGFGGLGFWDRIPDWTMLLPGMTNWRMGFEPSPQASILKANDLNHWKTTNFVTTSNTARAMHGS